MIHEGNGMKEKSTQFIHKRISKCPLRSHPHIHLTLPVFRFSPQKKFKSFSQTKYYHVGKQDKQGCAIRCDPPWFKPSPIDEPYNSE